MERGIERRYAWIEASLRFAGRFGLREKKAYRDRFGLTDSMVSRDQDAFRREFNERCDYLAVDKITGRLEPASCQLPEQPVFSLPRMTEWLMDALGTRFEAVPPIRRAEPSHAVLRAVVQAIGARWQLRVQYQPRRGGESVRLISPHSIVDVVGRLHLRGWDHDRSELRDLVLSRMISATVLDKARGYISIEHDAEWSESVVLEVLPRDGEFLAAVRLDYGLDQFGRAERRVRKAHMRYLIDSD